MSNSARIRDHREPGHFWADNEIIDQHLSSIGAFGFAVYMLLTRYANNKTAQCDPSVRTIGNALRISPPTVQKALKALEDAGLIRITYRPRSVKNRKVNETNIYTLLSVEKMQHGTQGDWVPKEIGYGVPKEVDKGTQGDLPGVPKEVGTNKTHVNKTKEREGSDHARPLSELALAIADVCKINPKIPTPKQKQALNATYQALKSIGATPADVRARETWWYANAWQVKKEGRAPRPDELQAIWEEAAAPVKKNGTGPPVASKPNIAPDALSPEELKEAVRTYHHAPSRTPTK